MSNFNKCWKVLQNGKKQLKGSRLSNEWSSGCFRTGCAFEGLDELEL
jgi:hypothetical protein